MISKLYKYGAGLTFAHQHLNQLEPAMDYLCHA